jgi:hypothetical protein
MTNCNFTYWYCTVITRPFGFYPGEPAPGTHGEVGGGEVADDGGAADGQGPTAPTRGTANPGGVLVLDDEQP